MAKEKSNWFARNFKNYFEYILVFAISIIITFIIYKFSYILFTDYYFASKINGILIELFGGLLGLLLTAYAIVFGIVPHLAKDLLDSKTFNRINSLFLLAVVFTITILLITIILQFIEIDYLVIIGLFFFISTILIILILSIILFSLLNITKNEVLKKS